MALPNLAGPPKASMTAGMFSIPLSLPVVTTPVNTLCNDVPATFRCMDTMGERLTWARKKAGYRSARAAALSNGWIEVTYRSHETDGRAFDFDAAQRYGRVF